MADSHGKGLGERWRDRERVTGDDQPILNYNGGEGCYKRSLRY